MNMYSSEIPALDQVQDNDDQLLIEDSDPSTEKTEKIIDPITGEVTDEETEVDDLDDDDDDEVLEDDEDDDDEEETDSPD